MAPFLPETLEHLFDSRNPINAAAVQALLRAYGHPRADAWHQWQARFGRLPAARLLFARFISEAQDHEFTLLGDCRLTLGEERRAWRGLAALESAVCQAAKRGWPPAAAGFELGALVIVSRQTELLEELGRQARYYRYRLLGQAEQPCYLVNLVPRQMEELEDLLACIGRYQPLQAGYAAAARRRPPGCSRQRPAWALPRIFRACGTAGFKHHRATVHAGRSAGQSTPRPCACWSAW